ncbi:sigma-70-like protein [Thermosporothrix hazakensis]|jgi:DNA-directed RNA polymerase specialized sigma24 family protein|uniref:Sigma-70-like protein n=1 Tax=Thermosporothrix hazakensis TaxID=644383 RepID=A0A326UAH9_THEHA|nr:sigma-70 region 4 domain-containing protein [Thermosporothrix hazakensis]PZW34266.1 sigma-70-like protein [Thermosporothrix hazakensis]GCE46182.1 hypothetical protein KTH_10510 [Thermosporothrix hazakensis]
MANSQTQISKPFCCCPSCPLRKGRSQQHWLKPEYIERLNELEEPYRTVLKHHDVLRIPYGSIALKFKCPPGTIKAQVSRGRKKLKDILDIKETICPPDCPMSKLQ